MAIVHLISGLAGSPMVWKGVVDGLGDVNVSVESPPWNLPLAVPDRHKNRSYLSEVCQKAEVVVAHSYAATLLLEYLSTVEAEPCPKNIVLVSPFYRPRRSDFRWAGMSKFLNEFDTVLARGISATSPRETSPQLLESMSRVVREQIGPYGWMEFYSAYLRTPDIDLSRVRPALTVVHGTDDGVAPIEDGRALAAGSNARLYELPGTGHFPMTEATQSVCTAIKDSQQWAHNTIASDKDRK